MSAVAATIRSPFDVETLSAPHFAGPVARIACPRMRDLGSMDIHALGHALADDARWEIRRGPAAAGLLQAD